MRKSKEHLTQSTGQEQQNSDELALPQITEKNAYQLLENLHEGIWIFDKDDRTTFVNRRLAEMLGYTEKEMLGQSVLSFLDKERAGIAEIHLKKRKRGVRGKFDSVFVRKDGTRVPVLFEASPMFDDERVYVGLAANIQDLSERKSLEEQIRQQKTFLTDMLESLPYPFYIVDANDYCVKMANSAAAFDTLTEASTCYALTHGRREPCSGIEHVCPLKEVKKTNKPAIAEHIHYDKDGNPQRVEVHAYPILSKDGSVGNVIVYALDITERLRAEEARVEKATVTARARELERSRQRIVNAEESIRRDIAQQLHGSVQNRLIVLLHQLEEVQQGQPEHDFSDKLTEMRQNLSDILESQLRPMAYRLYPSILRRGLVPALQSLKDRLESSLSIDLDIDRNLVNLEKFEQGFIPEPIGLAAYRVVEESLGNALKHASASKAIVSLKLASEKELRVTVHDNGRGFDVGKRSGGLGILFMRDYAGAVGGKCTIRSTPGKGTEVIVSLPL